MSELRPKPISGVYEKPFWAHVQEKELCLQRCPEGHFRYPPGPVCARCMSAEYDWVKVSGEGTIVSWTVFHRQYFPELPPPYTVVCAALKEGPLLIANLVDAKSDDLSIGVRVKIVYEESKTRDGSLILYQWSPASQEHERPE